MKINSFKIFIFSITIFLFVLFSGILFFTFNSFFFKKTKDHLITSNKYSNKVAFDFMEEEKKLTAENTRILKNHPNLNAIFSKYPTLKSGKIKKIPFIQSSALVFNTTLKYLYLDTDVFLELFDKDSNRITSINNYNKDEISSGSEDYIEFAYDRDNFHLFGRSNTYSTYAIKDNKLFIKGFSRFYTTRILGLVSISLKIDKNFLNKISKMTNSKIIIFDKKRNIIDSTFQHNSQIKIIDMEKESIRIEYENRYYHFSILELKNFNNDVIAYIGTGFKSSMLKELYLDSFRSFFFPMIIFTIVLMLFLYLILKKLFSHFDKLVKSIQEISNGNYNLEDRKIFFREFSLFHNLIKNMIIAIRNREKELIKSTKANYNKKLILSNIGHEIRTPLNSIINLSDILKKNETKKENIEKLDIVSKSGRRVFDITSNLLESAKIDSGNIKVNLSRINLKDLLLEIYYLFDSEIRSANINFSFNISDNIPNSIFSDKTKLYQIIVNLLNNAFKYTNQGFVIADFTYSNNKIIIEINDSGIGISDEKQDIIFQAYSQINTSNIGIGLGLFLVKNFVKILNGNLSINSSLGIGSSIKVEIPDVSDSNSSYFFNFDEYLCKIKPSTKKIFNMFIIKFSSRVFMINYYYKKNDINSLKKSIHALKGISSILNITPIKDLCKKIENKIKHKTLLDVGKSISKLVIIEKTIVSNNYYRIAFEDYSKISKKKYSILIVDDLEENSIILKEYLNICAKKIFIATNGKSALNFLKKNKIDIIFTDINMPIMNGIEFLKRIKKNRKYTNIPIIAISADNEKVNSQNFSALGFTDYIEKTLYKNLVLNMIARYLITDGEVNDETFNHRR